MEYERDIPATFHRTSIARNASLRRLTISGSADPSRCAECMWAPQTWYAKKRPQGDMSSGLRPRKHWSPTKFVAIFSVICWTMSLARRERSLSAGVMPSEYSQGVYRATSALGFESKVSQGLRGGGKSDLPVNETDLIVVGRFHVQGSGNHGLEGSIQLDPGVVAYRRVAGEML